MTPLSTVLHTSRFVLRRWQGLLCQVQIPLHEFNKASFASNSNQETKSRGYGATVLAIGGIATAAGVYYFIEGTKRQHLQNASKELGNVSAGGFKCGLPTYTLDEVATHASKEDGIWVTFRQGVYDITNFVDQHPGGHEKISMAAGGSVEPFWLLYGVHKTPGVLAILEKYRIGNLSEEEASVSIADMEDPYAFEPRRHPALKPSNLKPFNAEPPMTLLVDSFITPSDLFYVRNHLPVPEVDEKSYSLEVSGLCVKNSSFNLEDLKKFPKYSVTATIQCAGNRRSEMVNVKPVKGLNWGQAAIGNATWSGARLIDVLKASGFKDNNLKVQHIQFEGLDTDSAHVPYGASIPAEKALDPRGDVILAYEMNGQPIPKDHGFPVRVIVPGIVGARNVKWLGRIVVSEVESDSHWQQNDYKGFSPSVDWDTVDFSKAPAIQELPVVSAICEPLEGATVKLENNKLVVRGYAWSGGGRRIIRVDVTADGGKTWHVADFTDQNDSKVPYHWAWTLWKAEIPVTQNVKKVEIWAKAVDSSYNVQPERFENIWNLRGVCGNAYHRVNVNIK
ncbi:hypothetical protein R5R35_008371 [Gryllus longicercus]|uniref:Sulfite oxidase n=1 Tax=Gryllus longicercus TaxID=2509291 RepID=A0AAN9VZT9_9ORTH